MNKIITPTFAEEKALQAQGYHRVAGLDEAGRGAWVGPVVAAAVILPPDISGSWLDDVRDSKQISPARRELLNERIMASAVAVGIGVISQEIIDENGILQATHMAMREAVEQLAPAPNYLLIDYLTLSEIDLPQKGITRGDSLCISIACASIVAKVARDRIMVELDGIYPGYGLSVHKGYGTRRHLECLHRKGPCPVHRRSFRPVRELISVREENPLSI